MLTLDEAINRYERQTEELYNAIPCDGCAFNMCKKEHRQLAEWLRELKESRMVLDILGQFLVDTDLDNCCEDLVMADNFCEYHCEDKRPLCWYRWAKMKAREVKADDT
jgi:hypothetical protein